jgi:AcrR family transcriptional regulator
MRLRDRVRTETREAILRAAEQAFVEDGLDAARMESIAARAGVAVGTLYNHFDDRDALLGAVVDAHRRALLHRLDRAVSSGRRLPFEEALASLLLALFGHLSDHLGLLALLLQAEAAGPATRGRGPLLDEVTRRVETLLRRGRVQGRLRPDPGALQAHMLVGMVRGVMRRDTARGQAGDPAGRAAEVQAAFLRGLGAEP